MKNVVVFIGSRKGKKSNTYIITERIINQLKLLYKEKIKVETYTPLEQPIAPCCGCSRCFQHGRCPEDNKDGMQAIRKSMEEADLIVLGSGVYLHNVTADTKNLLDRMATWTHYFNLAGKRGVTITTSSSNGNDIVNGYLCKILNYMGCEVIANVGLKLQNKRAAELYLNNGRSLPISEERRKEISEQFCRMEES